MRLPKYCTDPFVSDDAWNKYGEELCTVALHEAGHFVVNHLVGGSLPRGLSIVPGADYAGRVRGAGHFSCNGDLDRICAPSAGVRDFLRRDVLMNLAGAVVEGEWIDSWCIAPGSASDCEKAATILAKLGEDFETDADDYARFVYSLLKYKRVRRAVRSVVDTILEKRELDCDNGLYDLCDLLEKVLGDYSERARRRIIEWTQARDRTQNAQAG